MVSQRQEVQSACLIESCIRREALSLVFLLVTQILESDTPMEAKEGERGWGRGMWIHPQPQEVRLTEL